MTTSPCPLVEPLVPAPKPEEAFRRFSQAPHCLFLDSALRQSRLGRYSFVAADPFEYLELPVEHGDCLGKLAERLRPWGAEAVPGLPPFQGGAAGLFGYDLGRELERLTRPAYDEFAVPALAVGFYDVVIAWDHGEDRAWIVSQGLPEIDPVRRRRRAAERLQQGRRLLEDSPPAQGASTARDFAGALAPESANMPASQMAP